MPTSLITASREPEDLGCVALSGLGDAVFLTSYAGEIKYVGSGVGTIFGYTRAEIMDVGHIGALLGVDLPDPVQLEERSGICDIDGVVISKSGEERRVLIDVRAVRSAENALVYTCRDVTERMSAQDALCAARLELAEASMGAVVAYLMATVAHDVNQPLTSIISNAEAGLAPFDGETGSADAAEQRAILEDIRAQGQRAADVVRRIRAITNKHTKPQLLDLDRLMEETLQLIGSELRRRRIALRTELTRSLPPVEADRVSLQQVLLNVIANAMDSMDDVDGRRREIEIRTRLVGDAIEIAVADSGRGIPANHLHKVFDPFFTTKRGRLGLGLAIARSIVEGHAGSIEAEQGVESGARFHVVLPCRT